MMPFWCFGVKVEDCGCGVFRGVRVRVINSSTGPPAPLLSGGPSGRLLAAASACGVVKPAAGDVLAQDRAIHGCGGGTVISSTKKELFHIKSSTP